MSCHDRGVPGMIMMVPLAAAIHALLEFGLAEVYRCAPSLPSLEVPYDILPRPVVAVGMPVILAGPAPMQPDCGPVAPVIRLVPWSGDPRFPDPVAVPLDDGVVDAPVNASLG